MRYQSNPKHKEPWQRGNRGSLCPKDIDQRIAQELLEGSAAADRKRYAVRDGRAYCAQQHRAGLWHGYPVGWVEVPVALRIRWKREGRVKRRDIQKHWCGAS